MPKPILKANIDPFTCPEAEIGLLNLVLSIPIPEEILIFKSRSKARLKFRKSNEKAKLLQFNRKENVVYPDEALHKKLKNNSAPLISKEQIVPFYKIFQGFDLHVILPIKKLNLPLRPTYARTEASNKKEMPDMREPFDSITPKEINEIKEKHDLEIKESFMDMTGSYYYKSMVDDNSFRRSISPGEHEKMSKSFVDGNKKSAFNTLNRNKDHVKPSLTPIMNAKKLENIFRNIQLDHSLIINEADEEHLEYNSKGNSKGNTKRDIIITNSQEKKDVSLEENEIKKGAKKVNIFDQNSNTVEDEEDDDEEEEDS